MELDISKNVLYDITTSTLERIEGLEIANAPLKNVGEVRDALGRKPTRPRALKVTRDTDGVAIDIGVNVEYGRNMITLAHDVQRAVTENVQLMTGLRVNAVNVTVQGLTLPKGA